MNEETKQQWLRNNIVLQRLLEMNNDEDWVDAVASALDIGLDEVANEDGFGTERQMDPRGDCRDEDYDMFYVQGVDD